MVLVPGAFGCPFDDFAFDDPRVRSEATCGIESVLQFFDGVVPHPGDRFMVVRGKKDCARAIFA